LITQSIKGDLKVGVILEICFKRFLDDERSRSLGSFGDIIQSISDFLGKAN